MSNKMRSHRGIMVDMEEIKIKNQEAVAVGNMNVNARGDEIDEYGRVFKSRDQKARENIKARKTSTNSNASVISSFEDEMDDVVEIKDDPKAIEKNSKKASSATTQQKSTPQKTSQPKDSKGGTSETDLG